jgi:hypothetical protein
MQNYKAKKIKHLLYFADFLFFYDIITEIGDNHEILWHTY